MLAYELLVNNSSCGSSIVGFGPAGGLDLTLWTVVGHHGGGGRWGRSNATTKPSIPIWQSTSLYKHHSTILSSTVVPANFSFFRSVRRTLTVASPASPASPASLERRAQSDVLYTDNKQCQKSRTVRLGRSGINRCEKKREKREPPFFLRKPAPTSARRQEADSCQNVCLCHRRSSLRRFPNRSRSRSLSFVRVRRERYHK